MKRDVSRGGHILYAAFYFVVLSSAVFWSASAKADMPLPPVKPEVDNLAPHDDYVLVRLFKNVFDATAIQAGEDKETATMPVPAMKPSVKPQAVVYAQDNFSPEEAASQPAKVLKADTALDTKLYQEKQQLSIQDRLKYKTAFAQVAAGDIDGAKKMLREVSDQRLRGHVLYQIYMHPTAYVTRFEELKDWLGHYNDQPGADKIYSLAIRKKPAAYKGRLNTPKSLGRISQLHEPTMRPAKTYRSSYKRTAQERKAVSAFKSRVMELVSKERLKQALKEIKASQILDATEKDILRAHVGAEYLYMKMPKKALAVGKSVAQGSRDKAPKAAWVSGLVAWSHMDYKDAANYFEVVARSPYSSSWTSAAGAFWAARSHMRMGNVKAVSEWLNFAAQNPRTFYGLLATRSLGHDFEFNWDKPDLTQEDIGLLMSTKAGARAVLLVSAGQEALAEAELMAMPPESEEMRQAMLAYAAAANLPGLALRLGALSFEGSYYDTALYPSTPWSPQSGFKIDPALINAIMRQESRFDPLAESASGARGLMQLMPDTASYIGGSKSWKSKEGQHKLLNPTINLELGQNYLIDLLGQKHIRGDLLSMLIAYNAGPGNLRRWQKLWPDVNDPLLFIELIPSSQARAYVERVLANYWIYRLREGLETPTLEALAEGREARYAVLSTGASKIAFN